MIKSLVFPTLPFRYPHLVAIDLGSMGYDGVEGAAIVSQEFFVVDDVDHSLTY